ncbi:dihydrofolate reductase family protein [Spirillospora sp. NPDC048911]|uniref:dihydrofolate reductase family protein n=1 Tax=Spirillospora sp. NPDC048911 TaxID=3364527 RepID=UPI0037245C7E
MRKLTVGSLVSLDGIQEAPRSWASAYFDDAAAEESLAKLMASDAMLMGRNTYEYFAPAWPAATGPYADRVNAIRKYVFSSTLKTADWNNSEIVSGDVVSEVRKLKEDGTGDLVIYGYGQLARTLMENDLVDELKVWIHPVILGHGTPISHAGHTKTLQLASVEQRPTGVVTLSYTAKQ